MFVKERWEKIIASLYQNGSVRVKELAEGARENGLKF